MNSCEAGHTCEVDGKQDIAVRSGCGGEAPQILDELTPHLNDNIVVPPGESIVVG
jgi:hypothetical protein